MTAKYNRQYAKTVEPRYYKRDKIFIVTQSKDIFRVTCKGLKDLGIKLKTEKQGKEYIIKEEIK